MANLVGSFGSVLGGLAAVAVIFLGATQTARLRGQEQTLRQISEAPGIVGMPEMVVQSMHRAAAARLAARQLFHPLRTIWPFAVWLTLAVVGADAGFLGVRYAWQTKHASFTGYLVAAFGDVMTVVMGVAALVLLIPQVFFSYFVTLRNRAQAAHDFYHGRRMSGGESYGDMQVRTEAEYRLQSDPNRRIPDPGKPRRTHRAQPGSLWIGFQSFFVAQGPGWFAYFLGFMVGEMVAVRHYVPSSVEPSEDPTIGAVGWGILGFALSVVLLLWTVAATREGLRDFGLPSEHPPESSLTA